tara:strand:- start:93 stop:353 length:261 start_codon:yes stop_codon:yes gene_type:complete
MTRTCDNCKEQTTDATRARCLTCGDVMPAQPDDSSQASCSWYWVKRYAYAAWIGAICSEAGWYAWTYQFWVAVVPMVVFVVWREKK